MTITSVETITPNYFPAKTITSPLTETYGGWVQYVTDEKGIVLQRIYYA